MCINTVQAHANIITTQLNAIYNRATTFTGHYQISRLEIIKNFEALDVQQTRKEKGCLTGGILSEFLLHTASLGKYVEVRRTYCSYWYCRKMSLACKYTYISSQSLDTESTIMDVCYIFMSVDLVWEICSRSGSSWSQRYCMLEI